MKFIALLFFIVMLLSIYLFPTLTFILSVFFLFFSLAISISAILKRHKDAENTYRNITKDILILIFTLLLVIALGGLAGMYANHYATQRFGVIAGVLSALVASFAVGYLVKWSMGKVVNLTKTSFS